MYPTEHCYFCGYPLTDYGECYQFPCRNKYQYVANLKAFDKDTLYGFKINNYGFNFFADYTMEISKLRENDIIIKQFNCPEWIMVTKENYLEVVERIKKLQLFK